MATIWCSSIMRDRRRRNCCVQAPVAIQIAHIRIHQNTHWFKLMPVVTVRRRQAARIHCGARAIVRKGQFRCETLKAEPLLALIRGGKAVQRPALAQHQQIGIESRAFLVECLEVVPYLRRSHTVQRW